MKKLILFILIPFFIACSDDDPNEIVEPCSVDSIDTDDDGICDDLDAFPYNGFEWDDTDGDGVGDNTDAFPNDPSETHDSDEDGVGDNSDNCPEVAGTAANNGC